jgi:hypothetical protein
MEPLTTLTLYWDALTSETVINETNETDTTKEKISTFIKPPIKKKKKNKKVNAF